MNQNKVEMTPETMHMISRGEDLAHEFIIKDEEKTSVRHASGSKMLKIATEMTKKYGDIQLPKLNGNGLAMLSSALFAGDGRDTIDLRLLLWIIAHQNDPSTIGLTSVEINMQVIEWFATEVDTLKWPHYMAALMEIVADLNNMGFDTEVDEGKSSVPSKKTKPRDGRKSKIQ